MIIAQHCNLARTSLSLMVQGDKVKFSLQFRGREMQFQEEGSKMFQVSMSDCKDLHTSPVMPCALHKANAWGEVVWEFCCLGQFGFLCKVTTLALHKHASKPHTDLEIRTIAVVICALLIVLVFCAAFHGRPER